MSSNKKFDIIIAMMLIVGVSVVLTLVMDNAEAIDRKASYDDDPEWYKYKITAYDNDTCMSYGVETWDGVYLGNVTASQLDSLIADDNQ